MENFRSKSTREGRMQMESYFGGREAPTTMHDLRSYSTSHTSSSKQPPPPPPPLPSPHPNSGYNNKDGKIKKSKSISFGSSKNWSFKDPELQRKKRVAGYKVYAAEGKMKGSFRKSFRWIKETCTHVVYGWW